MPGRPLFDRPGAWHKGMTLDIQSFWLIGSICGLGFGALVLLVRNTYPRHLRPVLTLWGMGYIALGLAYTIWFSRSWVGAFNFNVVSRVLVTICLSLQYRAITKLKGHRASNLWLYWPSVAMFLSSTWFSVFYRNLSIQLLFFNIIDMVMMIVLAVALARREHGRRPLIDLGTSIFYSLLAVLTFLVICDYFREGSFPAAYNFNVSRAIVNSCGGILSQGVMMALFLLMVSDRLTRDLAAQAMRDPLTGLFNRRAFEVIALNRIAGARRTGAHLAVIMLDIDRFKSVNDQFGHLAGDAVLCSVANTLRVTLRDEDCLCRWGGDEFCALLPRAGREQVECVAKRMIQAFDEQPFTFEATTIKISITMGIVTEDSGSQDLAVLLRLADEALYAARRPGNNGYVIATAAPPA